MLKDIRIITLEVPPSHFPSGLMEEPRNSSGFFRLYVNILSNNVRNALFFSSPYQGGVRGGKNDYISPSL